MLRISNGTSRLAQPFCTLTTVIDAAQLAAVAPPGGVLPPADETTELAYLDLRADCAAVAENKARAVAAAFGPSLYLRASLRLVVASGELSPAKVAGWFAGVAAPSGEAGASLLVTVQGESLLDRLEELMLAGCELGDPSRQPIAAWTAAHAAILQDAVATGASVVVTRFGGPKEVSIAVDAQTHAKAIGDPSSVPLELVFADGYKLRIDAASRQQLAETLGRIPPTVTKLCTIPLTEYADFARLDVSATDLVVLTEFARRFELAAPAGLVRSPLVAAITPRFEVQTTNIPTELLELGIDARPASDWSNDG